MNPSLKIKTLDDFILLRTLGSGLSGKVKLARHKKSGALFAVKILDYARFDAKEKDEIFKNLRNELTVLKKLDHPNIIQLYEVVEKGSYRGSSKKTVSYATLEFAAKGEIFDVLSRTGPLGENTARSYFGQLLSAMEYLSSQGVAHRDIKPENLLLSEKLLLKLVDFGFATGFDPTRKNLTRLGTERYMAPEVLACKPYNAVKADVFSAGIVLFIFVTGRPPFLQADQNDHIYRAFLQARPAFWTSHEKMLGREIPADFKALIAGMLDLDPELRLSFEGIRASQWMSKPVDAELALADMTKKHQATQQLIQVEKAALKKPQPFLEESTREVESDSFFADLQVREEEESPTSCFRVKTSDVVPLLEQVRAQLENDTLIFERQGHRVFIESHKGGEVTRVKLCVGRLGAGEFAVWLVKVEGDYLEVQEIKRKFGDAIKGVV